MRRSFLLVLAILLLAGCQDATISDAEQAVRDALKDPDSARFSDVARCGNSEIVTGDVNSKNSYGGYTGKQAFVVSRGEVAIMGEDNAQFVPLMNACTREIDATIPKAR